MGTHLKGGKTAPVLLQDILAYDPQHLPPSGFNQLTDLPVPNADGAPLPPSTSSERCRHDWAIHEERSTDKEAIRKKPSVQSLFVVVAHCTQCRSRLDVKADFRDDFAGNFICPTPPDTPFHHFANEQWKSFNSNDDTSARRHELACCLSPRCSAKLSVIFQPPVIRAEWIPLLTNTIILEQRMKEITASYPDRYEGVKIPEPTESLNHLTTYVSNALETADPRPIPVQNKKFMLTLGDDCAPVMTALGFCLKNDKWYPPPREAEDVMEPAMNDGIGTKIGLDHLTKRDTVLSDALRELLILQWQRPGGGASGAGTYKTFTPQSAKPYLATALGAVDYKRSPRSRTLRLHEKSPPTYAALGCLEDFDDSLLVFAYDLQVLRDPENAAIYFECLQALAEERQSQDLQTKVVMEASCGRVSKKDVRDAYQQLGLDPSLDDDTLAGAFKARIQDAPAQAAEARTFLKIIGDDRGSSILQQLASDCRSINFDNAWRITDLS